MTEEKLNNEFLSKYGINLYDVIEDGDYPSGKILRCYNTNKDLIVAYIQTFNKSYTFAETDEINDIIYEQMEYVLSNYDYTKIAFVDVFNNSVGDLSALMNRYVKPLVKIKLQNSGLCYRGLQ